MYEEDFALRLAKLRMKKGVSARDMSLSIGQNAGYINNIETGKALPSMSAFFYICDYLDISPGEFFNEESLPPKDFPTLLDNLRKLDDEEFDHIAAVIKDLAKRKGKQ